MAYPFQSHRYGSGSDYYNNRVTAGHGLSKRHTRRRHRGGLGWSDVGGRRRFQNIQPVLADSEFKPEELRSEVFARSRNTNHVPLTRRQYEDLVAARMR